MNLDYYKNLPINWVSPVNWLHHLNKGLVLWLLVVSGAVGGSTWLDMCGRNDGILNNMNPATDWVGPLGRPGGCGSLNFDGTGYISGIISSEGNPLVNIQACFCWLRFEDTNGGIILQLRGGASNTKWNFGYGATSGGLATFTFDRFEPAGGSVATATRPIAINVWNHVGMVLRDEDNEIDFYANGQRFVVAYTETYSGGIPTAWTIGADNDGTPSVSLDGQVDDLRVYNRFVSHAEVSELYTLSRHFYPGLLNRLTPTKQGLLSEEELFKLQSFIFSSLVIRGLNIIK